MHALGLGGDGWCDVSCRRGDNSGRGLAGVTGCRNRFTLSYLPGEEQIALTDEQGRFETSSET